MNLKRKSILAALLLIGSTSAMNQDNYSASDVRSMLANILQSIRSMDQRHADETQTLRDENQAQIGQQQMQINQQQTQINQLLALVDRQQSQITQQGVQIDQLTRALNEAHEVRREVRNALRSLGYDLGVERYLVPIMTSHSQDGYVASASSTWHNHPNNQPYRAFDRNANTVWASHGRGTAWIQIKLPGAAICNVAKITSRADAYGNACFRQAPSDFSIQGSNDARTWTSFITKTGIWWDRCGQVQTFKFPNLTEYQYYRLVITANCDGPDYSLGRLDFIYEEI